MTFTEDMNSPDEIPGVVTMEYLEIDEADDLDEIGDGGLASGVERGKIASVARRIAPDKSVLTSALGMSAVGLGAILLGSRGRRRSRFGARLTAVGLATIVGGSFVVAAIANKLTPSRGIGRIGGGVLAALGSLAIDRFLMRRRLLPPLTRSLGRAGSMAKYGAIGLGAMLGRGTA